MANLIQLRENKDAINVSALFENENERKEIYLKYLIVCALNNQSFYVNIANSMFYSSRFYSATKLFDFYVNNNLFDLIVLKPDSSEMLFDINRDEIHANIYGYVVARLGTDAKSTEILGYFEATDFDSVVMGHSVATAKLTPIENFANIEIIDNQLSLEDVSERFFELLSMFMDNDISKTNLSELACLLYNSAELRGAFAQVGMFDKLCADIGSNPDIVEKYLSAEIYKPADTPIEPDTEVLDEIINQANIAEPEVLPIEDTEPDTTPVSEEENEFTLEPEIIEEPEVETEIIYEPAEETETEVNEEIQLEIEEGEIEEVVEPEQEPILQEEVIIAEPELETTPEEEVIVTEPATIPEEDNSLELIFDEPSQEQIENAATISQEAGIEEFTIETEDLKEKDPYEIEELTFTEEPIDESLDEFNIDIPEKVEEKIEEIDLDKLAEEQLSDIPEQPKETYDRKWEKLSLVTEKEEQQEQQTPAVISDTPKIEGNDELMNILAEVEDDVNVDDNEIISMLKDKSQAKTQPAQQIQQNKTTVSPIPEKRQSTAQKELTVLYKPVKQGSPAEFSTGQLSTQTRNIGQATPKKSNKKRVAIAAAAIIVLGLASITTNFILNGDSKVEEVATTQNETEEDYQFPIEGDTEATNTSMPAPAPQPRDYVPNLSSSTNDTKIVSSSVSQHRGAAPVILKSVAWQVPTSITNDPIFNKYLQIAGKNIKMNLASDLLEADDFAYNNKIKVSMTVRNNTAVKNVKVVESSGSKNIDDLVLQSIKLTLKYINTPVMTTDTGDKDIVLVISI